MRQRVAPGDIWALLGNLPPGTPTDLYAQLVELIQSGGRRAFLDTSDESLRLGCAARPYAIKLNLEEAVTVLGRSMRHRGGHGGRQWHLHQEKRYANSPNGECEAIRLCRHSTMWYDVPRGSSRRAEEQG